MLTRRIRLARCSGHNAMAAMIATQLGLAMMPLWRLIASALISGTTSGTSASMRKAEEFVDDHRAAPRRERREVARDRAAGGEQRDVDTVEAALAERLDGDGGALNATSPPGRTRRGVEAQGGEREAARLQALRHDHADGAGGADDGNNWVTKRVRLGWAHRLLHRYAGETAARNEKAPSGSGGA